MKLPPTAQRQVYVGALALGLGLLLLQLTGCQIGDEFLTKKYFWDALVGGSRSVWVHRERGAEYRNAREDSPLPGDSVLRSSSFSLLPPGQNEQFGLAVQQIRLPRLVGGALDSATYRALPPGFYDYYQGQPSSGPLVEVYYVDAGGQLWSTRFGPQTVESYWEISERTFQPETRQFAAGAEVRLRFACTLYNAAGQQLQVREGSAWGQFK